MDVVIVAVTLLKLRELKVTSKGNWEKNVDVYELLIVRLKTTNWKAEQKVKESRQS